MKDLGLELMVLGTFLTLIVLSWIFSNDLFNILDAVISIFGGY